MQANPEVLQEQLEQLQQQHDHFRAEAQQSMQAKDELLQQLQEQNHQAASSQTVQVRARLCCVMLTDCLVP